MRFTSAARHIQNDVSFQHFVALGRDHLLVVHWVAQWPEITEFEEAVIDALKSQPKFRKLQNTSSSIAHQLGARVVTKLHWRHRLWPDPVIPNAPVLLRYDGSKADATAELERFESITDPKRRRRRARRPGAPIPAT